MSTMYSRIEKLCKENYLDITKLCRELQIPRSSLSELKSGRAKSISADKVSKIADYFHVSASYITNGISDKFSQHTVDKEKEEEIKATNRNIVKNYPTTSLTDCVFAQIQVFKCLFTRSLRASGYDNRHVTFEEYVAYMLGQETANKNMHIDIYNELVKTFGVRYGMADGTSIFDLSQSNATIISFKQNFDLKIALWQGDANIVDDEMIEDIKDFAKLLVEKKKRKMEQKDGNNLK